MNNILHQYSSKVKVNTCFSILGLSFLLLFMNVTVFAQRLTLDWVKSTNSDLMSLGTAIVADETGNAYIVGSFMGTVDLDPGNNTLKISSGNGGAAYNTFLAKYDATGKCVWAKAIGGSATCQALSIKLDDQGNVVIAGYFSDGNADFNPTGGGAILNSTGIEQDAFIAKYDKNGNYIWVKGISGIERERAEGLATDNAGNLYITGEFTGTSGFGGGKTLISSGGSTDVFLAKYDRNGNCLWAKGMGGNGLDQGYGITIDNENDILITGLAGNAANFDPGQTNTILNGIAGGDIFIAKYNTNGNYIWAKGMGSIGYDVGAKIEADRDNNVYVTGSFAGTVDFDPGAGNATLNSVGGSDIFIAKYSTDGNYIWAKSMGSSGNDAGSGLGVTAQHVYVSGVYSDIIDLDPGTGTKTFNSAGATDIFIAQYDTAGNYVWAGSIGGIMEDAPLGLALDNSGNIYSIGIFQDKVDFDPGPGTSMLSSSAFVETYLLKLSCGDTSSVYTTVATCGDSYTFGDSTYHADGRYIHKYISYYGCDSTIILDLTLNRPMDQPVIREEGSALKVAATYTTYQWMKNGAAIPGATDSILIPTENGDYSVAVTNKDGCTDTSEVHTVTQVNISDVSRLAQHITIYPNPTNNILHIKSPSAIDVLIRSIEGVEVLYKADAQLIETGHLAAGIYFLQIVDKKGRLIKVEKIVKEL